MYLKSLELSGFKSFAKKTALSFNTPISAIVGPNGSGKSNISEAFRFVLGEQSVKSMRGKRTEDLIWNGGKDAARANRASVELTFDNTKRIFDVDFDEVTLGRIIYRDASSEYYINSSSVRLKDIVELLSNAHIGASGHHIISQGEADRILNANSRDRRIMVEDALGLKVYQYKRQESERKLQKTEENVKQVESLRREITPHIRFLKKQVEKVEKAMEMKRELATLYKDYLKREQIYLSREKHYVEEAIAEPKEKIKKLEEELSAAKKSLVTSDLKDEKSAEVINLEKMLSETRMKKDGAARELGRLEGECAGLKRLLEKDERGVHAGEEKIPMREIQELNEKISFIANQAEAAENIGRLKSFFREVKELVFKIIERYRVEGADEEKNDFLSELKTLEGQRDAKKEEFKFLSEEENKYSEKYAELRRNIESGKDKARDAEREIFRVTSVLQEERVKLKELFARQQSLQTAEEEFKREIREGLALVGRDIAAYETYEVVGQDGVLQSVESLAAESRGAQDERRRIIEKIKIRLEDAGAASGEDVLKEYREVSERDAFLACELDDLGKSAESLRGLIAELGEKLDNEFRDGIEKINKEFNNFFTLMFDGGGASLSLEAAQKPRRSKSDFAALLAGGGDERNASVEEGSEESVEEPGIEIQVNLPRKKIKGLMMLSGGERTLTSIALLFAMSQVNPPPFLILDETDAALDEANSKKYGDMVENLSKYSQLILITHNRETMSRAGIIYGVTMDRGGISKLLSIAFDEAAAVAK
ncbi:MAG: AAA family ATPase [bacterium]|nr:AAA family ATPase [bacterium]